MSSSLSSEHIAYSYVLTVVAYCLILAVRKIRLKKKQGLDFLIIPKLNIHGISGISMMTAMNIALIITISLLSNQIMGIFFKVYPGARFLIENILIKLGGILYGPLIGIFIGFTTDLLTVIFTSSVLNYGYFFSAMMNGFLGGLIHQIIKIQNDKGNSKKTASSIGLALVSLFFVGIVLSVNAEGKEFSARILSFSISLHWGILFGTIFALTGIAIALLAISSFANKNVDNEKYNYKAWIHIMSKKYLFFLILVCNSAIYILIDIIALPMFDISLSTLPYEQFLICRIITSIPSVILFSYLIHYIYRLHSSISSRNSNDAKGMTVGVQPFKEEKKKDYLPKLIH
ncbi:hypothetical protein MHSWG343_06400 [Candidatus Mycoplasma haematohominis]|uniref:Folate transporter FolT n=1 Tax=Candidatus Mycoplasma haematohominis TaxID=1494318 RepID=A0A478FQL8_9MOLU|nr:hypothetical protein MHSWG343_06400 [Candidatus Mycoplasma haemohominis]